jgi:hypothetical protein
MRMGLPFAPSAGLKGKVSDMSATWHVMEIDMRNALGGRVVVVTCLKRELTCIADDLGRCTYCNEVAV